jgi:protein-S-isoprenylcysteine O-methyltransferase Ste14
VRSRVRSLLGSALFLVIAPGTVAGYLPWLITRWQPGAAPPGSGAVRLFGLLLAIGGVIAVCDAFLRFAWTGRGTPAPVAPPEVLVVSGLHRYVRNPMYLSVGAIVVGEAIWLWRYELLLLAAAFGVLTHLFVVFYEEPTLRRQFGAQYVRYCRHVRRWRPRLSFDPGILD